MSSRRRILTPLLATIICGASACRAVVIADGDGSGNTTAPADDPGFANIGSRGVGSAIYLGNRWVLTAYHVGPGPVTFGSQTFPHIIESAKRVTNPRGYNPASDMVLFRLADEPNLPALHLGCESRSLNDKVVMIGRGRDRMPDPTFWRVIENRGSDDDVWQQVASEAEATAVGFFTGQNKTMRWGENVITDRELTVDSGYGEVVSLRTTFDRGGSAISNEAQGVVGDSGAGLFYKDGPIWELTGMIHSVDVRENQPGGASSTIFGGFTYAADLALYADQLRAIADFEPRAGDLDGDGELTAADLDLLRLGVREGADACHLDLNGDDEVTPTDTLFWLFEAEAVLGDADLDGRVAFGDFLLLADNYGLDGGWAKGDFDGDARIGFGDFLLLSRNFGLQFPRPTRTNLAAVPEPGAMLLALLAALMLNLSGPRRRRRDAWGAPPDFASGT